jgi:hypothetical protein
MVSSTLSHSRQMEGPIKPLFERLSQVSMLEWEISHRKIVNFGQCQRLHILRHSSLVGGGFNWVRSW